VLDLLKGLRGIEPLKELFWSELNYQRVNEPLSRRGWTETASKALAEDPFLFAGGGEDNDFHVIYGRLASDDLSRGFERPVVTQMLREHPYALFIFSNKGQTDWHFLNVKFDDQAERRRLFRRITVRPGAGLRTATERVQLLDLAEINPDLFGITPLAIQQRCDVAFDVEAVTKDFFREIANWYFWALKNVQFPKDAPKEADGHDHISVIRLITRLIFCWFVKEKGLIPDTLFDERKLTQALTGFAPTKHSDKQSVFYRAILQNLFFATLNTEMDKRGWTKEEQNFMAHSLYRHRECFSEAKTALDLFKEIPFLNGGLFECLDKDLGENAKPRYVRIDGFSRREDSQPIVPDFLFFGGDREVDLSAEYDDKKFKCVPVRGLIHIFNRFNFTIEENTPIEQEVALDPELSGKVFENLLAAYNPETGATARKKTGSFYTPREIVNYMVDEALIACLKAKVEAALPAAKSVEASLRHLFAYNDEPHRFNAIEVDTLITAIDSLKSLDPAVGSGAFPMGILHKLVFILGKLDPRNEKWKERQISRVRDTMVTAEKIEDATARERAVRELEQQIIGIGEAFEHNELDYGRKLYLIENCIYGVDIQPIAVQIAKMRFFISLIVDQKIDDTQPNRGVRPLPNLETKFVASNTLIGVNRPGQQLLRNREIDDKEAELRRVRERHFLARTPKQKTKCRDDDAKLRTEIAELLKGDGWDTATARKLASWNPYNQNASADFFDPEWMFGILKGFDVLIENPPYIQIRDIDPSARRYFEEKYQFATGRFNLFYLFIEISAKLSCSGGFCALIVPDRLLLNTQCKDIRKWLLEKQTIHQIVSFNDQVFDSAVVDSILIIFQNLPMTHKEIHAKAKVSPQAIAVTPETAIPLTYLELSPSSQFDLNYSVAKYDLLKKIAASAIHLGAISDTKDGIIQSKIGNELFLTKKTNAECRKLLVGENITRYGLSFAGLWVDYRPAEMMKLERAKNGGGLRLRERSIFERPKILTRQTADKIIAAYDQDNFYYANTLHGTAVTDKDYHPSFILGVLNSRITTWFYRSNSDEEGKVFAQIKIELLRRLPIPKAQTEGQKPIIKLVGQILASKARAASTDTSALEREVDQQVYTLYGLTAEEIKIVEAV
jgi:adenine-specific DNA-methyltransferase